jgi:hypothetical protein
MRSGQIRGLACAAILTAGLLLVACGGGDDHSTTAISKPEFVNKATAICITGNGRIGRVVEAALKAQAAEASRKGNAHPNPTSAEIAKLGKDTVIPTGQRELDQIRALGAPSGQEDEIKALLSEQQSVLDKVKEDPSLYTSLGRRDPFAGKLAQDYGLSLCSLGA